MKNAVFTLAVVLAVISPGRAAATPYFRLLDPTHPTPVLGALLAPEGLGGSEAASLLPIFTHSPADGCLLPSVVCEDWTPLALGASVNAGKITFDVAPLANVLPWMSAGALHLLPDSWERTRAFLTPVPGSGETGRATFSAGPAWQYQQRTNKGYFRIFTGLALHF